MNLLNLFRQIAAVSWLNFYGTIKGNPIYLLTPFAYPLSVLLIMLLYTGEQHLGFLLAGAAIYQSVNAGMLVFSETAASKHYFKMQDLFVASPASPFAYALG